MKSAFVMFFFHLFRYIIEFVVPLYSRCLVDGQCEENLLVWYMQYFIKKLYLVISFNSISNQYYLSIFYLLIMRRITEVLEAIPAHPGQTHTV